MPVTAYNDVLRPEYLGPALADALGDPAWHTFSAELITGGKSNLTFRLAAGAVSGEREVIVRRPPTGTLRPSAHDMARESRVQRALAGTGVPVPRILLDDPDGNILGLPCYVMSAVPGLVVRDELPAGFAGSTAERRAIAWGLVDTLAAIHGVDVAATGIGDPGRAEGFMARQVRRWRSQWEAARDKDVPDVERLAGWLAESVPERGGAALVHGDFRLDNCVLDPGEAGRVNAVLDWEMSTVGDPLADLGLLLFYWREPGEEPWRLAPSATRAAGFPGRSEIAARYADRAGADLSQLAFYEVFAYFKFAVITQDVAARAAAGSMAGQDFGDLGDEVARIAAAGLRRVS